MPETLNIFFSRWLVASAVFLGIAAPASCAWAQMNPNESAPGSAPVNPMCPRLEAQLASIDRGSTGDPARDDQVRRYQDAAQRQQGELDRTTAQAKRLGCDNSGFFSLFQGQSAQCGPVNTQIQQMRSNLDQINSSLAQLRGGGGQDNGQRRSVLIALAQNHCGPQYAAAAQQSGPGAFFNNLFGRGGGDDNNQNPTIAPGVPGDLGAQSGTYRTVCVRTCDGGYFPVSFATVPARFPDDEKTCKALCPATEANLFSYRNPGEDINAAVSINGQPYTQLPNAFHYRNEFNPSCACKAAGQTWSEALQGVDDKAAAAQQGDIIVTEENAKKMSQAPSKTTGKKGAPPATQAAVPPPPDAAPGAPATAAPGGGNQIRSVGPTFVPAR